MTASQSSDGRVHRLAAARDVLTPFVRARRYLTESEPGDSQQHPDGCRCAAASSTPGVADRLVHPRDQVMRLWEHWGRPEIIWYAGAHTGIFQSRPVQDFIDDALRQSGLVAM
jgi:hypothetical protein